MVEVTRHHTGLHINPCFLIIWQHSVILCMDKKCNAAYKEHAHKYVGIDEKKSLVGKAHFSISK